MCLSEEEAGGYMWPQKRGEYQSQKHNGALEFC